MSFSSEVKEELAKITSEYTCCEAAQAYGMLECGHAFSASAISLQTENAAAAAMYRDLSTKVCSLEENTFTNTQRSSGLHIVSIDDQKNRVAVLERFGHAEKDVFVRLNRANIECEHCAAAYLRGAFLSCGAISNPQVDYHLEFCVPHYNLSRDLLALMGEIGLKARLVRRKGSTVIYLKESEQIEDCLTMMGAINASLELMNVKMVKDIRNAANRIANCESANIDKTISASMVQIEAIRRIQEREGLDSLPEDLRELAYLRIENPDLSLRELGELLSQPISRSGVNHRLRRLIEIGTL